MTLYLKLGGRPAFQNAVQKLKNRMLFDGAIDRRNQGASLQNTDDLCEFLIFLSGGAPFYDGQPIAEILSPLCPDDKRYEMFVGHLVDILIADQDNPQTETELRVVMEHIRPHVVSNAPSRPCRPAQGEAGVYAQ